MGVPAGVPRGRVTVAVGVGQVIEWFDWTLYASFAVFFADSFFPADHGTTALLSAFAVYAVGFLFRPLGGVVLGHCADRIGRSAVFNLTILMMAGGSLAIAVLPTYEQIGTAAPVLLVLARAVQGLSAGGEMPAATALVTEAVPAERRAFHSSSIFVGTGIGVLLASALGWFLTLALTQTQMTDFGWRIAFGAGALIGCTGFVLRRSLRLSEPSAAAAAELLPPTAPRKARDAAPRKPRGRGRVRPSGIVRTARAQYRGVLRVVGFGIAATVGFYTLTVYMPTYLTREVGMRPSTAFMINCIVLVFYSILPPFAGLAADRLGRRPVMGWSALALAVVLVPSVALMSRDVGVTLPLLLGSIVLLTAFHGPFPALMSEQFPAEARGLGVGIAYSLVTALFGGTATYLAVWFSALGHPLWFFAYVSATFALAAVTLHAIPESAPRRTGGEAGPPAVSPPSALPNPPTDER
ncbi:MFS transporter [Streptomyces sp. NPDC021093]|uniref:MFS transporter n=1 Tax=Streptomyces sp. NPDC021093 TaxID=3365112 RepID=UPI0037989431